MNGQPRHQPPPGAEAAMRTLCECGKRFGAHRVNDFACPNPQWKAGNGKPQWLDKYFRVAV